MEYAELRLYDKYGGNKKENKEDKKINSNNINEGETIKKYRRKVIEQREEIKKYQKEIAILKNKLEARN